MGGANFDLLQQKFYVETKPFSILLYELSLVKGIHTFKFLSVKHVRDGLQQLFGQYRNQFEAIFYFNVEINSLQKN